MSKEDKSVEYVELLLLLLLKEFLPATQHIASLSGDPLSPGDCTHSLRETRHSFTLHTSLAEQLIYWDKSPGGVGVSDPAVLPSPAYFAHSD